MHRPLALSFFMFCFTFGPAAALTAQAATAVTQCGQVITGSAELTADLDCSAFGDDALVVLGGPLRLRGHTLTGPVGQDNDAVLCEQSEGAPELGRCRIIGPGAIVGGYAGVRGNIVGVKDVDLADQEAVGVLAGRLKMIDSTVTGAGRAGFESRGGITKHRILRSTLSGNAVGAAYVSCIGCGHKAGIKFKGSTVTDNTGSGVLSYAVNTIVKSSTVTGNALDQQNPACDLYTLFPQPTGCADIATADPPVVRNTPCDTSLNTNDGSTWGVCTLD